MNYRKLVPDREQRGIMWMIIGLVVAVPVVFAAILAFKVLVTAVVFMVCTWLIHHVIDAVPALGLSHARTGATMWRWLRASAAAGAAGRSSRGTRVRRLRLVPTRSQTT